MTAPSPSTGATLALEVAAWCVPPGLALLAALRERGNARVWWLVTVVGFLAVLDKGLDLQTLLMPTLRQGLEAIAPELRSRGDAGGLRSLLLAVFGVTVALLGVRWVRRAGALGAREWSALIGLGALLFLLAGRLTPIGKQLSKVSGVEWVVQAVAWCLLSGAALRALREPSHSQPPE